MEYQQLGKSGLKISKVILFVHPLACREAD
jgi:hypothetical protein